MHRYRVVHLIYTTTEFWQHAWMIKNGPIFKTNKESRVHKGSGGSEKLFCTKGHLKKHGKTSVNSSGFSVIVKSPDKSLDDDLRNSFSSACATSLLFCSCSIFNAPSEATSEWRSAFRAISGVYTLILLQPVWPVQGSHPSTLTTFHNVFHDFSRILNQIPTIFDEL